MRKTITWARLDKVDKPGPDVRGFTARGGYFFWRRAADDAWCCIHDQAGTQDLGPSYSREQTVIDTWWRFREEVFRAGDILEVKL